MEKNQMKNIVVLKNLPSNLIDEAIVILKSNRTAKKLEYIDKKENLNKEEFDKNKNNYIIREAESVISNYINVIERREKRENNIKVSKRYRNLKVYSIIVTVILFIVACL